MRDPKRIKPLLRELEDYWLSNPDLRLCQIIGNFLNQHFKGPEIFRGYNVEDDQVLKYLESKNRWY